MRFLLLAAATVALVSAFLLAELAGYEHVLSVFHRFNPIWLPVCFGSQVLAYLGYVLASRDMARVDGGPKVDLRMTMKTVVAGFGVFAAANASGGFAIDYWALRRAGARKNEAVARVLGLNALEYVVLAPAALICAMILFIEGGPVQRVITLPWLLVVPGFAVAFWLSSPKRRGWARIPDESGRLRRHFGNAVRSLALLRCMISQPRQHGAGLVGASLYWFGDIVCLWAALHAFSAHLPLAALVVGYATGYVLTRRSLPFGGAGVVEVSMTFALTWVGLHFAPALAGVIVYRLFNFWFPIIPALATLPTVRELRGELRRAERDVPARHAA
jgi:uncharacterized membrane protein YbhN (UPF0104 family)